MNIRCSKRCANPVRPVRSRAEPTLYQTLTVTTGTLWSSCMITLSPLGSLNCMYGSSSGLGAAAAEGVCAEAGAAAQTAINSKATRFMRRS